MSEIVRELRHGLRQLKTHPSHSAVVVVTLGLAIGLSAVVFSFVSFFLLRPLPVRDEKTMVIIRSTNVTQSMMRPRVSYPDFVDYKAATKTIEELVALTTGTGTFTGHGEARRVAVAEATQSLFRVWGLGVVAGRGFEAGEDAKGAGPVMILSHGYWSREFGKDAGAVGGTFNLDGRPTTVVGILDPKIEIGRFSEVDVWTPLQSRLAGDDRQRRDLTVTGRRKSGVTLEQVNAEFQTLAAGLSKEHPETNRGWTAGAIPLRDGLFGTGTAVILSLLSVGICLVFAVACANVAGVMLARATTREKEMAVRLSLGASQNRIILQLVIEAAVLSVLGAALGLVLAQGSLLYMRAVAFEQFYELVRIDSSVLGASLLLALVAPVLFGLAPALQMARNAPSGSLHDTGSRSGTSGRVGRSRRGLVLLQIGLATALLIVSGLAVRTAVVLRHFDFGFPVADLLTVRVDLAEGRYPDDASVLRRVDGLVSAMSALPQVASVAAGTERPVFDGARMADLRFEGRPEQDARRAALTSVTADYVRALGLRLKAGRTFQATDTAESAKVVLVNEALAARDFSGKDPLGARIKLSSANAPWLAVAGVVSNIANPNLGEAPAPQAYVPFAQRPDRSIVLLVRTAAAAEVLTALRSTMRTLDPDQPIYDTKTMEQVAWEELASNRIITGLFAALGLVALALAAVGLYGLTAFLVAQRTREIGVRMALGATVRDVLTLVLGQGARLTVAGLTIGLVLGLLLGRAMASILVGVSPSDPLTLAFTLTTLGLAAGLAHWIPARRAATINPVDALRHD